ncbi:MAG: hypothetical protein K2J08_06180 [Ruminococcus sp.]|nr:hypothetical protein [Ruminococcus sp.]
MEERTYSESEYKALENQLEELKKSCEDYKQKWEASEQALKDFEYQTKVGSYVKQLAFKNDIYEKYFTDLITEVGLKFDGDTLIGVDGLVKEFREKYPEAFRSDEELPEFSVSMTGDSLRGEDSEFVKNVMGIK